MVYHAIIRDLSYRKHIEENSVNLGKMSISEHIAKGLGDEIRNDSIKLKSLSNGNLS